MVCLKKKRAVLFPLGSFEIWTKRSLFAAICAICTACNILFGQFRSLAAQFLQFLSYSQILGPIYKIFARGKVCSSIYKHVKALRPNAWMGWRGLTPDQCQEKCSNNEAVDKEQLHVFLSVEYCNFAVWEYNSNLTLSRCHLVEECDTMLNSNNGEIWAPITKTALHSEQFLVRNAHLGEPFEK